MPFKSKLSKEDLAYLKQLASEGVRYTEIVKKLGGRVTKQRVHQICQKAGIDANAIGKEQRDKEHAIKMTAKWGVQWENKEHRRTYVYQAMRSKFSHKKANAVRIGIEWNIEFGDLDFPTHCPVLGIELNYFSEKMADNSPSFDRLDPTKGYVKGNVFIISQRANRIKNDGSVEEHKAIIRFIESGGKPSASSQSSHCS